MAQYTKHPVLPRPEAPKREATGQVLLRAYSVLILVAILGHTAVYNGLGYVGAAVALATLGVTTAILLGLLVVRKRPAPFAWRRLPFTPLSYVALAGLSVMWSRWPDATAITWPLLAACTLAGVFLSHTLSWRELIRVLSSALQWIVGLSLAIELWASVVLREPILPNFIEIPDGRLTELYWVRDNLLDGGRIQGIVGNANMLAILCILALIVFTLRFAEYPSRRPVLALWILLAGFLLVRTGSATALVSALAVGLVTVFALLLRRARSIRQRRLVYAAGFGLGATGVVCVLLLRDGLLTLLGRGANLTGRSDKIWTEVIARAGESPLFGGGFSSPWVPTDPAFAYWIIDHGLTVFHAHNMWLDVFLQLGVLGLILMVATFAILLWRAWFFATDRPRWDLRSDRPYSALSLLPLLITTSLLVWGMAESAPIMLWGWVLVILLSFKLKSEPCIPPGTSQRTPATQGAR